jgi:hypothetical protein
MSTHSFLTDLEQKAKDVSGTSHPSLNDPEKSKKGEGVTDTAKIHVSRTHIDSQGWCFISHRPALSQSIALSS